MVLHYLIITKIKLKNTSKDINFLPYEVFINGFSIGFIKSIYFSLQLYFPITFCFL